MRDSLGVREACTIGKAKREILPKAEIHSKERTNLDVLDITTLRDQKPASFN